MLCLGAGVALVAWLLQQRSARHRTHALLEAMEKLQHAVAGLPALSQQVSTNRPCMHACMTVQLCSCHAED